jgi:hypothetical protein
MRGLQVQVLKDESRKLGSSIRQVWSLAKDTEKKVEALYAEIEKVSLSWLTPVLILLICHCCYFLCIIYFNLLCDTRI